MDNEFRISGKNQRLSIYPVSDLHYGSEQFDEDLFDYWKEMFEEDENQKVIYLLGDILESGSKSVGNSAFNQNISLDEQMNWYIDTFKPYAKYIRGITQGNHEARLKKEFDLDITNVVSKALDVPYSASIYDTIMINDQPYTFYGTHGNKVSAHDHLQLGMIKRTVEHIDANVFCMGHSHKLLTISDVRTTPLGYKRRYYVNTGSFLGYEGSYAEDSGLRPSLTGFSRILVDRDRRTNVELFNSDEVLM